MTASICEKNSFKLDFTVKLCDCIAVAKKSVGRIQVEMLKKAGGRKLEVPNSKGSFICDSTSPLMFGNISWESAYYYIMLLVMGSQDTEIIMCMYGGFGLTITAFLSTRSSNSCVPCEPALC